VLGGYNVSLEIVDDAYKTSNTINNMNAFVARDDIFGFAGVLGTSTSIVALPIAQAAK
jgi:ABC-type branched-subunit amino acid transport system substrate-binding protein